MFEWDRSKDKKNQSKHGISFADTFAVFEDPNAVTLEDFRGDEQRFVTMEWTLSVVFWWWFTRSEGIIFGSFPHARLYAMR
jgi:uncharacterized DUF497 family protein